MQPAQYKTVSSLLPALSSASLCLGHFQAGERVNAALQTGTERSTADVAQEARTLLDQAGDAQAVSLQFLPCASSSLLYVPR